MRHFSAEMMSKIGGSRRSACSDSIHCLSFFIAMLMKSFAGVLRYLS